MKPLRRVTQTVGVICLIGFMFLPTLPDAITDWGLVSSWAPGMLLFFSEPFGIIMSVSEELSFAREVAASPESYPGDGLEASVKETVWAVLQHILIFAGSIAMILCAFRSRFSRTLALGVSVVMTGGLLAFAKIYVVERQTHHVGVGAYLWILSCVALLIAINTDIEPGAAGNGCPATSVPNQAAPGGSPSVS